MENNNTKKYYHDYLEQEDRTDANLEAKQFAQQFVDKFEEEKRSGANLHDLYHGNILNEERRALDDYNVEHVDAHQIEFWGNTDHNTLMGQFATKDGHIIEEIVSSPTPAEITDRTEYYDSFRHILGEAVFEDAIQLSSIEPSSSSGESFSVPSDQSLDNIAESLVADSASQKNLNVADESGDSSSLSSASQADKPLHSHKRTREDDEDDNEEGSSKRARIEEDNSMDTVSSIYDLAGDD